MDKRIKFGYRQKLLTVRSIMSGRESCISAAKKIGSKKNTVQRWVILYKQHGRQGLQLRNGSYDGNFKVRVVRYMLKNKLSFRRTAVIFKIPQDYVLSRWLKIYEHLGAAGLLKESRGRKKSQMNKKTQKKKKGTSASKAADESVTSLCKGKWSIYVPRMHF